MSKNENQEKYERKREEKYLSFFVCGEKKYPVLLPRADSKAPKKERMKDRDTSEWEYLGRGRSFDSRRSDALRLFI